MQTFHKRFEARWLGSLKPMVLSNCSYWVVRGVKVVEVVGGKGVRKKKTTEWGSKVSGKMETWQQDEMCLLHSYKKYIYIYFFI